MGELQKLDYHISAASREEFLKRLKVKGVKLIGYDVLIGTIVALKLPPV